MKTPSNRKNGSLVLALALVSALVFSSFVVVENAYADEGVQPEGQHAGDRIDARLEAFLVRLNEWYVIQDQNLAKANQAIARIEELLATAEQRGIDVAAIETHMPDLYAAVGRAESSHATAGTTLDGHAGFNGGGKVKDRQQAIETLRSARNSLDSAKNSLLEARDIVLQIIEIARDLRDKYVPARSAADFVG